MAGLLVSFEGIDFCGKSVQSNLLFQRIRANRPGQTDQGVVLFRDPGGTRISERIREILLENALTEMDAISEILLYSAARSQLVAEEIKPNLERGGVVILDRFFDSTTAFQGYGREIDLEIIQAVNRIASHGVAPDLTFILDLDVQVADERRKAAGGNQDRIEIEETAFHERVRVGYQRLAAEEKDRVVLLDGSDDVEHIADKIWTMVDPRLPYQATIRR